MKVTSIQCHHFLLGRFFLSFPHLASAFKQSHQRSVRGHQRLIQCFALVATPSFPAHMPLSASRGHVLTVSLLPRAALAQPPPPLAALSSGGFLRWVPGCLCVSPRTLPFADLIRSGVLNATAVPTAHSGSAPPPRPPPCSHRFLVLVSGSVARTSHRRLRHSRPKGESLPRSERLLVPTASNQFSRLKLGGHPWFRCFLPLLPPPPHLMTHQLVLPSAVLTDVSAPSTSLGLSYHCHLRGEHLKPCPPHLCSGDLGIFHWKSRFALDAASVGLLQGKPD